MVLISLTGQFNVHVQRTNVTFRLLVTFLFIYVKLYVKVYTDSIFVHVQLTCWSLSLPSRNPLAAFAI